MTGQNILDILAISKRGPQVVMPKDAGIIIAYTGASPGWKVLDAGTGSGWLSMFLANIVKPGKVISYEKRPDFAKNVKEQIKRFGIKNLQVINKDIFEADVRGKFDLITLDMKDSDKILERLYKNLNNKGWIATYSPHIEQVKSVNAAMINLGLSDIKTVENIIRDWKVDDFTHPIPSGIMHTGFMVFGRKC